MRILYHHRTLGDGAEGIHIKEMVNAFRSIGHDVLVVGPSASENLGNKKSSPFSILKKIVRGPAYETLEIGYNFYNYYYLSKIVSRFKPDFIYDRYITFNYSCVGFGKKQRIPVFLEVNAPLAYERDHEPDESLYMKEVAYWVEKKVCSNSLKTIVVSTPLKEYLISKGVPAEKVVVIPNGVNIKTFYPKPASTTLIQSLGIRKDDVIIGFVGILRPWHGIDLLLDAFGMVHARYPNSKLMLVGDGPIRESIQNKARDMGLGNKLIITGRVPHDKVSDYVSLFTIAVSPKATFYASPMKIPEYMAQQKAVVAPDTDNIKDLIVNGETGILFENDSAKSLAESLKEIISNQDMRSEIGNKAKLETAQRLNWQTTAKHVETLFLDRFNI
ncbi:glycosyltransferase family 4 protein [uncultured Desulfobacter sp.]|uniref:glycosyltransferase family 4 protein n=1 Tax=uncultured Desulfobacter sp. TaxID=240139 RepID=UPI0029C99224|nr:glycosyltransferase family 4 protein [uncultured Desulfobacter sp.]